MAVVTNQADSKLKLVLNAGLDENNKDIIKNKTFSNIKSTVNNDDYTTWELQYPSYSHTL